MMLHNFATSEMKKFKNERKKEKKGNNFRNSHIFLFQFCGSVIAGLSLLSNSVMKFEKEGDTEQWAKVLIPARSLYIQR